MLLASLALLCGTGLIYWQIRPERSALYGWLSAVPILLVLGVLGWRMDVADPQPLHETWTWLSALKVNIAFRVDGLGYLFSFIILLIGAVVAQYTHYYLRHDSRQGTFYTFLFFFMASMLGIVWADNAILLFVFWEGTTITSYLLIGHRYKTEESQKGARTALYVTGSGGLVMLAGLLMLAAATGSYAITDWMHASLDFSQPAVTTAMILILVGAFTKSGQFPVHFWLPGAMAAPTPASAYLHSATMVKAGIFLVARFHPIFADHPLWFPLLLTFGLMTVLVCAVIALIKTDLKAILAYATLTQLGLLFMALSMNSVLAISAAIMGILAHAFYKGPLFLLAGILDHALHTRDIRHMAQLARPLKFVFGATLLSSLSMLGLPIWPGFIAKEILLDALLHGHFGPWAWLGPLALAGVVVAGSVFATIALAFVIRIFLRRQPDDAGGQGDLHPPPPFMVLGPLLLALAGTLMPFLLNSWLHPLLSSAVTSVLGHAEHVEIHVWSGIGLPLALSLLALATGTALFWRQEVVVGFIQAGARYIPSGEASLERLLSLLRRSAEGVTYLLQGRSLTAHIAVVLSAAILFVLVAWRRLELLDLALLRSVSASRVSPYVEMLIVLLAIAAAMTTVLSRAKLVPVIAMGVVGLVVSLWFVLFAAPDLALTQLLVEVLVLVLIILILYKLPNTPQTRLPGWSHLRNVLLAVGMGVFGFMLVILTAEQPHFPSISDEILRVAARGPHGGANVVNVILVDFRGFDTFGEMTVIAIAGLGVYSLVRAYHFRIRRSRNPEPPSRIP